MDYQQNIQPQTNSAYQLNIMQPQTNMAYQQIPYQMNMGYQPKLAYQQQGAVTMQPGVLAAATRKISVKKLLLRL
jgi:hypothetical protein